MDEIERRLRELEDRLTEAWRAGGCMTCPLGELSALASAVRVFYVENSQYSRGGRPPASPAPAGDHWTSYIKKVGSG